MDLIDIDASVLDQEHICCALGNDRDNRRRADQKKAWMRRAYEEGLVFTRLNDRGKMFVEYMPVENCWKPVIGTDYYMIHCLWVSGKFKGQGIAGALLQSAIDRARAEGKSGLAVLTASKKKPFLTDKRFFERHGFEIVDTAPPFFQLMALPLKADPPPPRFSDHARLGSCEAESDFHFVYSDQCVFIAEYVERFSAIAREKGFSTSVKKLESSEDVRRWGSPFGTLGIYYKNSFFSHELMPEKRFAKLLEDL